MTPYLVTRDDPELVCRERGAECRVAMRRSRMLGWWAEQPGHIAVRLALPVESAGTQWREWWVAGWDAA